MTDPTLVPVRMGDCRCAGGPHADGDYAYLRPYLLFDGGLEAAETLLAFAKAPTSELALARALTPVYLRHGIVEWTREEEVTPEAVAALPWEEAYVIGQKADDLYSEAVLRPLVAQSTTSSPGGLTAASTSPKPPSRRRRRSPSAPS